MLQSTHSRRWHREAINPKDDTSTRHGQSETGKAQQKHLSVADPQIQAVSGRHKPPRSRNHRKGSTNRNNSLFGVLSASHNSIRVVKVLPQRNKNGFIQCQMQQVTTEFPYLGLSYEWGTKHTRDIALNNSPFKVRVNLHQLLEYMRVNYAGKWLWVDALCIDQKNVKEKSHQVQIMGTIFSEAQYVLSFIPKNRPSCATSPAQNSSKDRVWKFLTRIERNVSLRDQLVEPGDSADCSMNDFINGITEICHASYWERLWIIQEVALAKNIMISDGVRSISWRTFQVALQTAISHVDVSLRQPENLVTSIPFRLQELRTGDRRSSLMALLADFRSLKCANFHDRVFGLLSLAINGHSYQSLLQNSAILSGCWKLPSRRVRIIFCCQNDMQRASNHSVEAGKRH